MPDITRGARGRKHPRNPGQLDLVTQHLIWDSFTKTMLHFDGVDGSTTIVDEIGRTWTPNGNAQLDIGQYRFTSSLLLDGSGDWIDTPDHADFDVGSGDFTIDFWFRTSSNTIYIYGQCDSAASAASVSFYGLVTAAGLVRAAVHVGTTAYFVDSATAKNDGAWHHYAAIRSGSNLYLAIDGVLTSPVAIGSGGVVNNSSNKVSIGRLGEYTPNPFNGHIDEFRFSKGVARWTANFTPQPYPYGGSSLLDDSFSKVLLHFNGPDATKGIFDESGKIWTPNGNAQLDTAQSKFGGASGLFPGTTDYLSIPDNADFHLSNLDWTFDFWLRIPAAVSLNLISQIQNSSTDWMDLWTSADLSTLTFSHWSAGAATATFSANVSLSLNTWHHIAVERHGNVAKIAKNGTFLTVTESVAISGKTLSNLNGPIQLNAWNNVSTACWIDEFRFSLGIARWTSNFTPPTQEYIPS